MNIMVMCHLSVNLMICFRSWKDEKLNDVLIWMVPKFYPEQHIITNRTAGQEVAAFVTLYVASVLGKKDS